MAPFVPGKGPAALPDDAPHPDRRAARRTAFIVLTVLASFVALALVATVWVGVRAVMAKSALERTHSGIAELRADPELSTLSEKLGSIAADIAAARALTGDPVWRSVEFVPVLGGNLTAVRELADATGRVGAEIIAPSAEALDGLRGAIAREDERIDVDMVEHLAATLTDADESLVSIRADVADIRTDGTIGAIVSARSTLDAALAEVGPMLASAAESASLLPAMLGADGPRSYLLLFANNAEARPLQGNPASLAVITVEDGAVSISAQASSRDFPRGGEPPLALPPEVLGAYYDQFPRYVMDLPTRPDFPTTAELAQAYWRQQYGTTVDGVVVIDPIVLGYLLEGAEPIALPGGQQLTSDDAATLLLSDVYSLYPAESDTDPEEAQQNAFFQAAAAGAFASLTGGGADPTAILRGAARGVDEGRLMFWSSHPDEQAVISDSPLAGTLPLDNVDETTLGVYLMNMSSNKMDFWTDLRVDARSLCGPDGAVYQATYTIDSTLTREEADSLPFYQAGGWWGTEQYRTDAYLLGPVGSRYLDAMVEQGGINTEVVSIASDLGRPVVRLATQYAPDAEITVTVRFALDEAAGPLTVRTTPLVRPVTATIDDSCR